MTEHTLKFIVDEKDTEFGCEIVRNRDLIIRIEPENEDIYSSIEVVVGGELMSSRSHSDCVYHIVLHPHSPNVFTIKFIYFNNMRTLLINNYQVLQDKYTNFKSSELESMLPIEHKKFDSKSWKKEESDYDYVMSLARDDDNVRSVLSKCGFCF